MTLFIPITKVDAAQRLVYGRLSQEVPDRSGEIFDYESGKAAFQKWSDDQHKASGGKSKGNLRAMHGKIAAGVFTDISFHDADKAIDGCAKVVDDAEWEKVQTGTYTGFSIGGGYAKRWADPTNPTLKRYTPELAEVSLVDSPCVPTATFEFIKEDGTRELRKFTTNEDPMTDTFETPADDAPHTRDGVRQRWLAKDGSDHLTKAEAVGRNQAIDAEAAAAPALATLEKLEAVSLGKKADEDEDEDENADDKKAKKKKKKAAEEPDEDDDEAEKAAPAAAVAKGMYAVSTFACLLDAVDGLVAGSEIEAGMENDESAMPEKLKAWLKDGAGLLRDMVAEETEELAGGGDEDVLAMADAVRGLAKRGAKLSAASKGHIAAMHQSAKDHLAAMDDGMKALGLHREGHDNEDDDEATAEKAAPLAAENAALRKALGDMTPRLDDLLAKFERATATITEQNTRIAHLENQPAPAKGALRAVDKSNDGNASGGDDVTKAAGLLTGMSKDQIDQALMKAALAHPVPGHPSR